MLLSIIDHAYEDVREEILEGDEDETAKQFNEDFVYFCHTPYRVVDALLKKLIEKSAGGKIDFDTIKKREKIDPAMLMVLKFERMTHAGKNDDLQWRHYTYGKQAKALRALEWEVTSAAQLRGYKGFGL